MKEKASIFKNKIYTRMLLASIASQIGSTIGITAFLFYLLEYFSDKPNLSILHEVVATIPILFVFFLIGVFADRFDRQKIAFYSDTICAFLCILLLVSVMCESLFFMFLFIFLRELVRAFFHPAEVAIIQGTLSKDEYMVSSGINQMVSSLMSLFGRGIGIFIYWLIGLDGAIVMEILAFVVSALLIRSCQIPVETRLPNGKNSVKDLSFKVIFSEYKEGLVYIVTNKTLRNLIGGYFVFGFINSAYALLPIFLLKYKLAPTNYESIAVVEGMVIGGGILLGTAITIKWIKKLNPMKMISVGLLLTGATTVLLGLSTNIPFFLIALFGTSLFLPIINLGIGGTIPLLVSKDIMGRVSGCITPIVVISQVIMYGAITVTFPAILSAETLFILVGVFMLIVSVYFMIVLPKNLSKIEVNK